MWQKCVEMTLIFPNLQIQLCILSSNVPDDVHDVYTLKRHIYCKCLLDTSFSALRRLKTYLRSNMSQEDSTVEWCTCPQR